MKSPSGIWLRNTLIQKAVALYLRVAGKKSLNELLKEGYVEMAEEATAVTQVFRVLNQEVLKYVE